MKYLTRKLLDSFLSLASCCWLGATFSASAQLGCDLVLPAYPSNILTSYVTAYPGYNTSLGINQPLIATFEVDVTNGTSIIPEGIYPAWCVDAQEDINTGTITIPGTLLTGYLYSTCDPNVASELPPGHSGVYVTPAVWQEVNYILNNSSGVFYWDVQAAINTLVGPLSPTQPVTNGPGYPVYDPTIVASLVTAASNNAATWTIPPNGVIGALYVTPLSETNQIIIIEVPSPATPGLGVTKLVACAQPGGCGAFSHQAAGFASPGSGLSPAFCYDITVTNSGNFALTNVSVVDNLLGNLTSFFFPSPMTVFAPGASITKSFTMSFPTNATNTVLVQGNVMTPETVTNAGGIVISNGMPISASDQAVAIVDTAAISCDVTLSSPHDLDGNPTDNHVLLPSSPSSSTVTFNVTVCNTGHSDLTGITLSGLSSVGCTMPPPFELAAGLCTNIQLCVQTVNCPGQTFTIAVTGQIHGDATHCAVSTVNGSPMFASSACMGIVEYSVAVSGTVFQHCNTSSCNFGGDMGLMNVPITLLDSHSNVVATLTTDTSGDYAFSNLLAGTYTVKVTLGAPYVQTCATGAANGQTTVTLAPCHPQVVNFAYADKTPPTVICPPNLTIVTNCYRVYCTFAPCDWGGSCNSYNNCWGSWNQNNNNNQCASSFNNWWQNCSGNNGGGASWWNSWNSKNCGSGWWAGWSGSSGGSSGDDDDDSWGDSDGSWGSWWNQWSQGNNNSWGNQCFVPCGGNSPGNVLCNNYNNVYPNGCVKIGYSNGYCLSFNSCAAVRNCFGFTGNPGTLKCSAVNPTSCAAGSFCAQVLALQLNCDFGDAGCGNSQFFGPCGDLVLNNPTLPCNGKRVRDICAIANCALGGGPLPQGCTLSNLCYLVTCLNQSFECCQVSGWCSTNLCPVYNPPPSKSGWPTVIPECAAVTNTNYCDVVTPLSCSGSYEITRTWTAMDASGLSNYCQQIITIEQSASSSVVGKVVVACSGDTDLSNNQGLAGVTVTLMSGSTTVATTTTDNNGNYSFNNVIAGSYTVVVTPPVGYTQTAPAGSSNSQTVTVGACACATVPTFAYIGSNPGIQLTKCGPSCATNGQTIIYTFKVCNTSNSCLSISVNDPLLGGVIFTQSGVAPGQSLTFTSKYTINAAKGACALTNTATATGTAPNGKMATSAATAITALTTKSCMSTICGNFNNNNPGGGYVWCNAHISAQPKQKCNVFCQNGSITFTCNNGKTYTYPVPDCKITFDPNCTTPSSYFDGTCWNTTISCNGDDQILLSACGIPWNSDFTGCKNVCWTANFCSDRSGFNCNWQWGAACYKTDLSNCGNANPKPCHSSYCPGYNGGDQACTPENDKSYCTGGGTGGGGSNYTGSWSGTGSATCK